MSASKLRTRALPQEFAIGAPEGYALVGRFFQAYAPPEHDWDAEVVRAIRNDIDPEFCPMWCNYVYRAPDKSVIKMGRHWIWLELRDVLYYHKAWKYLHASSGVNAGRFPNFPVHPLEADRTLEQIDREVCGDFQSFGWWVYDAFKRGRDRWAEELDPDKEITLRQAEAKAESKKRLDANEAAMAYKWDQDWPEIKRAIIADDEHRPHAERVGHLLK